MNPRVVKTPVSQLYPQPFMPAIQAEGAQLLNKAEELT